jgi:hypothetical protein
VILLHHFSFSQSSLQGFKKTKKKENGPNKLEFQFSVGVSVPCLRKGKRIDALLQLGDNSDILRA